jgi:hypothetical protein
MTRMTDPVSSIRNLGPAYEASLARVGVHSADELRKLGADAAYALLLSGGDRPHFIGYYALVMALQGRPWNDCKGVEKDALRIVFDRIKNQHLQSDTTVLEDSLNLIGTGTRR